MLLLEKINFAYRLLDEVREEVETNIGSPPFPDLDRVKTWIKDIDTYLDENEDYALSESLEKGED